MALQGLQGVTRLYKFYLRRSIKGLDKLFILDNIDFIGRFNPDVLKLIRRFMFCTINDGYSPYHIPHQGIPRIGEITDVLFHTFLIKTLDCALRMDYPGITFTRYGAELFIATNKSSVFEEADSLLERLKLYGDMQFIEPEDHSYLVGQQEDKLVFLEEGGRVSVLNAEDV